jgi:hypothetical protein
VVDAVKGSASAFATADSPIPPPQARRGDHIRRRRVAESRTIVPPIISCISSGTRARRRGGSRRVRGRARARSRVGTIHRAPRHVGLRGCSRAWARSTDHAGTSGEASSRSSAWNTSDPREGRDRVARDVSSVGRGRAHEHHVGAAAARRRPRRSGRGCRPRPGASSTSMPAPPELLGHPGARSCRRSAEQQLGPDRATRLSRVAHPMPGGEGSTPGPIRR